MPEPLARKSGDVIDVVPLVRTALKETAELTGAVQILTLEGGGADACSGGWAR